MNKEQLVKMAKVIAAAIMEAGEIPSGHLYAALMSQMSLDEYNSLISVLVRAGLVEKQASHLLVWKGPVAA